MYEWRKPRRILTALARRKRWVMQRRQKLSFANREGFHAYNFTLSNGQRKAGVSAMLRVKNEQAKIGACLASIYEVFDEIVIVDNGSTDQTSAIVQAYAGSHDGQGKITLYTYPFSIARCGDEHAATPEDSVHSLVYYYNWCLSRCTRSYVFKWDADMLVIPEMCNELTGILHNVPQLTPEIWRFPIQTIYQDEQRDFLLAKGDINEEPRLFPNSSAIRFYKADLWEQLQAEVWVRHRSAPKVCIYEWRDIEEDEFSHWTDTQFESDRKRREWENFQAVKAGNADGERFERIPSPVSASSVL